MAFCMFHWRSTEDFSTPKFLTIGPRQRYNLKISVRELLYSAIFCACPVKLPHGFPKQYYSSQSEIVLKLGDARSLGEPGV